MIINGVVPVLCSGNFVASKKKISVNAFIKPTTTIDIIITYFRVLIVSVLKKLSKIVVKSSVLAAFYYSINRGSIRSTCWNLVVNKVSFIL